MRQEDSLIIARMAVTDIVADLTDRRGLKSAWWVIDEDIQQEIEQAWADIIKGYLDDAAPLTDHKKGKETT